MATLSPSPKFRAFDANGNPLSGGKLYAYEAGTTTLKDTFTTASGVTANSNPVILDSAGYADVWLGEGLYKLVLTDSLDNTLWTVDNISGEALDAFGSQVITQATNLTITETYAQAIINCTNTQTHSLPAAATVGAGFYYVVKNTTTAGTVTIDPLGSETINGSATFNVPAGASCIVYTNGTAWFTAFNSGANIVAGELVFNNGSGQLAKFDNTDNGFLVQSGKALVKLSGSAGADQGGAVYFQNATTINAAVGHRSVIVGGAYNATLTLYNLNGLLVTNGVLDTLSVSTGGDAVLTGSDGKDAFLTHNKTGATSGGVVYRQQVNGTTRLAITTAAGGDSNISDGTNQYLFLQNSTRALATGGQTPAAGYTAAGDITLPASGKIRSKNTAAAWANFNGTGTVAIRDSFNVTSITDNGTGSYTLNLTNAIASTNGIMFGNATLNAAATGVDVVVGRILTTTTVSVFTKTGTNVLEDCEFVQVSVFA